MAITIEAQARKELQDLENIVTAVEKLTVIAASMGSQDMDDFAYVAGYLGDQLQREFQSFHETISRKVLPLVADITVLSVP